MLSVRQEVLCSCENVRVLRVLYRQNGGFKVKCCNQDMTQERAKQYLEYRYECQVCRYLIAVDDAGNVELLRESRVGDK